MIEEKDNIIAIAWNQTSVNCNMWDVHYTKIIDKKKIRNNCVDDDNLEEDYRSYNLYKDKGHWFLFEEYNKYKRKEK